MSQSKRDVTQALLDAANGDRDAAQDLWSLTYPELRGIARSHLRSERADHTLSPTVPVHEAYVRLVDHARRRVAPKRGGEQLRITLG